MGSDKHWKRNTALGASTRLDHAVKRIDQHMVGSETKGKIDIRVGDGRTLGERGVSKTLGNGGSKKAVVLPRLISEPEESEKDERAEDGRPSGGLKRYNESRAPIHEDPGELEDARISPVCVFPGAVWINNVQGSAGDDVPSGHRDGETEIYRGESDETPVAAVSQVGIGGDEIPELLSPLHEGSDC